MANDAATLLALLRLQLREPVAATWTDAELNTLVARAVNNLFPRVVIPLLPATYTQALTASTYTYSINAAILAVSRIDLIDTASNELGALDTGTWRVEGDLLAGTAKVRLAPGIVDGIGGTIRYTGYGRYNVTTLPIPDDYVTQVLAAARVEAYRRIAGDRVRFKQWSDTEPSQNTSVNELAQFIAEAQREADQWKATQKTWRKPLPARVG